MHRGLVALLACGFAYFFLVSVQAESWIANTGGIAAFFGTLLYLDRRSAEQLPK